MPSVRGGDEEILTTTVVATTTTTTMFVPPPRRRHAEVSHKRTYRAALTTQSIENVEVYFIGRLVDYCQFCNAKFFQNELCVVILRKLKYKTWFVVIYRKKIS